MATKSWHEIQVRHSKRSSEERAATKARAIADLEIECMTLAQIRRARALTQTTMAQVTGMAQGDISRLERRTDSYIGTVRRFVEALGGKLTMIAEFPDSPPIEIEGFGNLADSPAEAKEIAADMATGAESHAGRGATVPEKTA